jgi:hypothetical protein
MLVKKLRSLSMKLAAEPDRTGPLVIFKRSETESRIKPSDSVLSQPADCLPPLSAVFCV